MMPDKRDSRQPGMWEPLPDAWMSGSVCQVGRDAWRKSGLNALCRPISAPGNKAPCCGVSKFSSLDADVRVEGGVRFDLIGKRSSVGEGFCDNEVIGSRRTHQPGECQEGEMESRRGDRVTILLVESNWMQGRRWFHALSGAISWRHSTHVIEFRGGSMRRQPVQSKSRSFFLLANRCEQYRSILCCARHW